ncbi:MAG: carboxypeptidase regulatory-like domain-containing protein [Deltaproteobacteria bacterium]|nr:carboxypeptidase regulatory-like domain-containing protein [Deltaproteobacteria bacterium]MBW2416509.1 carboxypeptidase regulatory-like domain-containing protein [Deltaproteobacteria bacterium]
MRHSITLAIVASLLLPADASAAGFEGRVRGADGAPVEGAMVTFRHGDPSHEITVYSGPDGRYLTPQLAAAPSYSVRVRRIGWRDLERHDLVPGTGGALDLALERETDPASVAGQLPANRWWALVLEKVDDPAQREELVRQCTYCHQQGNWATRMLRPEEQWQKVLHLMARMGAGLSTEMRERIPTLFNEAYDLATAVPRLTRGMHEPDFAPPPDPAVHTAVIEEWAVGHRASMQHDLVVHHDGRIYSVDMMQDKLYRLDPRVPGGERRSFDVPRGDLPLGGVFGGGGATPAPPNTNAHVGPHSLQVDPQGGIWITLALGNQIARFDTGTEEWTILPLEEGYYPHTLRIDPRGRIWYTVAASNHVGVHDPATGTHDWIRLPAPTWGQAVAMRMLPFFLWLNRTFDLSDAAAAGEGVQAPIPYGIDIAPDGTVWISQLNAHRLGRIDPDSFDVEMIDTPFTGPRRLRFDSRGNLWIPGFSSSLLARFDPETREFKTYPLPIEPLGTETPYALNVDRRTDTVWICGTNSDTLIRFEPDSERFTVYPLPTRVTYTREIDFDEDGGVWTSNSNMPTWQIEGAIPKLLRLDPGAGAPMGTLAALPAARGD